MKPIEVITRFPEEFEPVFGKGQLEQRAEIDADESFVNLLKAAIEGLARQGTKEEAARQIVLSMYEALTYKVLKEHIEE